MSKDNGGPAFPTVDYAKPVGGGAHMMTLTGGMTLRDYFAAKIMAAQCGNSDYSKASAQSGKSVQDTLETFAKISYQAADAMLAERAK